MARAFFARGLDALDLAAGVVELAIVDLARRWRARRRPARPPANRDASTRPASTPAAVPPRSRTPLGASPLESLDAITSAEDRAQRDARLLFFTTTAVDDTGLGREAGYASDAELLAAADAERRALPPAVRNALDGVDAELEGRFLFGTTADE